MKQTLYNTRVLILFLFLAIGNYKSIDLKNESLVWILFYN